ncbi:triose-phosphate isomerase [Bacillaceae bacterium S4-13-58]
MSQAMESFIEQIVRKAVTEQLGSSSVGSHPYQRKALVVANWKMNMELKDIHQFVQNFRNDDEHVVICPSFPYLFPLKAMLKERNPAISIGAQNIHWEKAGAYTGDVSASQIKDIGCDYVLVGHSERRAAGETDEQVNQKTLAALSHQIKPIICVGETEVEKRQNQTNQVVTNQVLLALNGIKDVTNIVIAYEPVWAIGSGQSASAEQAQEVHQSIRSLLLKTYGDVGDQVQILYGGSVKPANVHLFSVMKDIDGVLVGGASLKADDFAAITQAFL